MRNGGVGENVWREEGREGGREGEKNVGKERVMDESKSMALFAMIWEDCSTGRIACLFCKQHIWIGRGRRRERPLLVVCR